MKIMLVRLSEMSDRNRTCQPGRVTPHRDVQPGPTTRQTPFSGRDDMPLSGHTVNKFRRPAVLQLNIEGLTASKMNVLRHLTVQYEVLVIIPQETHYTCADMLTIPGFALAGSSLSRKHGLATFVHDRLRWTFAEQSPATSETEWLCVDVDGYRIFNVYKPPPTQLQASGLPVFPFSMLAILIVRMSTGVIELTVPMESALLLGQASMALSLSMTKGRGHPTFWSLEHLHNPDLIFVSVGPHSRVPSDELSFLWAWSSIIIRGLFFIPFVVLKTHHK